MILLKPKIEDENAFKLARLEADRFIRAGGHISAIEWNLADRIEQDALIEAKKVYDLEQALQMVTLLIDPTLVADDLPNSDDRRKAILLTAVEHFKETLKKESIGGTVR